MRILKQKNHGLPGLGINGKAGETGQKAQSIYMGYINDFFDGEDISIGTFIYAAKRRQENVSQNISVIQKIVKDEVSTGSQDSSSINGLFKKAVDNSSSNTSSYINYNILYFTGNRLLNSSINNNIVYSNQDLYEPEIDLSGDYISMAFMLNTATKNENIQAIKSTRIKQFAYENDASVDVKMNEKDNKFSRKDISELYNIINQVSYYEFKDNAKLLLNSYVKNFDSMVVYAPFEANDAIYERDSDAGKAAENGTLLYNSSYSNYYTSFPIDSSITYVIDDISFNNNENYYILDVNNTFSELYPISIDDASLRTKLTNVDDFHQFITDDYDSQYYKWPELYKTSFKDDTYYTDNDLKDAENKSFYGVASPWLFLYKGETRVQLNDASLLQLSVPQSYIDNYKNANTYTSMLVSKNGLYVYYSLSDNDQVIRIPSTLKKEYVVGDVLYFYTNLYDYNNIENPHYQNLLYMVVLTEDLIGCTPTQLVSSAQLTSPLEIKFFSEKEKRLSSYNNIAVLLNKEVSNQSKLSNRSLLSIIDNYTSAPVILASSNTNNINVFTAFDSSDNFEFLCGKINENNYFDISTSGNSTIKINQLYVANNISNVTNIELYNHIYNSNIKFYENNFIRPLLDLNYYFDETSGASVFLYDIDANDYFYNVENLSDYLYGCDIYNNKMEKIDTIISNNKSLEINLVPIIGKDVYYFQMFASSGSSLKYFSKITKLTLFYNLFNHYDNIKEITLPNKESSGKYWKQHTQNNNIKSRYQLNSFKLEILGDNQSILKNQQKTNNIFFDLSNITAEQSNASLSIYANDPSIIIDDITFNRKNSMSFNNNWVNIHPDSTLDVDVFKFNIDLSTNLPKYGDKVYMTLNEYVLTGKSKDESYESNLFTNLTNSDYIVPESKQRSILVTTKYHYIDNENESFCENFNIVQPGFKDPRGVPTIKLNSHTKMEELSSYNSIKNGVLTNQFVTYVDIDISDFKKQWGQFVNEDVSIFMDISIRNIDYDLNWQYKNIVENLTERRTFRAILEESDSSINHINNYVKFSSAVFETSENLLTKNTASCISTNGSLNCGGEFNLSNNYVICSSPSISENNFIDPSNGYILFDSSVINAMENPQLMYSGIQDNILLELKDIPVCDDINTIKLKLSLEMGNPMLSNLYLRFVVDYINIKIIKSGQPLTNFHTAVIPNQDTYLSKTTTDVDGSKTIIRLLYRYISDPIDVTFNPLSYIVCPNDIESSYTNIYGDTHKYGIKDQIKKELKFFNSSIYKNNPYNYSKDTIRTKKYYPFNNLYIKKSYIQDNIKQISVNPISLLDTIKYIDCSTLSLNIDPKIIKENNILDFVEGNKYLGIVYHSIIMQPRIENDQYIFHYNDKKYLRSKYNQKFNNMPVFAYDTQSIKLRDDELIISMDKWNDYYASSLKYADAKTYQGVLSLYGNGYTQILDTDAKDVSFYKNKIIKTKYISESSGLYNTSNRNIESSGLYNTSNRNIESSGPYLYINSKNTLSNKIQSLEKVKELNDVSINLYKGINEVDIDPMKSDQPNNKEYLRGFLYDINWEFPYYDNKGIWPYRIVSPFDNLLNNIDIESEDYNIYKEYYNALIDTKNSPYGTNMIPYNLLFDLNPRIAYNYENDGVNVLMLRRPSIGSDTDNIITSTDFKEKYEFNNQLFDLTNQIEKLKSPYTVK